MIRPYTGGHKTTVEQRDTIVTRYNGGESSTKLSREYGLSEQGVLGYVKRRGFAWRPGHLHRSIALNEHAFDRLTPEACYWVGFIVGDGYVSTSRNTTTIGLKASDCEHLAKFRLFMGSAAKIVIKVRGAESFSDKLQAIISIYSKVVAERLDDLTSETGESLNQLCSSRDFWRGLMDADGSLGIYQIRGRITASFKIVGTQFWMQKFAAFCSALVGWEMSAYDLRRGNILWEFSRTLACARRVIKCLYDDAPVALDRKAFIANQMEQL